MKNYLQLTGLEPSSSGQLPFGFSFHAYINCVTGATVTESVNLFLFKSLDMDGVNSYGTMSYDTNSSGTNFHGIPI